MKRSVIHQKNSSVGKHYKGLAERNDGMKLRDNPAAINPTGHEVTGTSIGEDQQ
ncbi:hypothetical protein SAMN05216315_1067 [Nitrosospira sp. Nsp18]|nr:hypothetical protein SAMN05216315_1067 [Nitrosospira sp. Nsp18]